MGIIANFKYRGIVVSTLYFRVTNIVLANKQWSALVWGFKDRDSSIGENALSPAFSLRVETPYFEGQDPYPALYAALHADPSISDVVDVLNDPATTTTEEQT